MNNAEAEPSGYQNEIKFVHTMVEHPGIKPDLLVRRIHLRWDKEDQNDKLWRSVVGRV